MKKNCASEKQIIILKIVTFKLPLFEWKKSEKLSLTRIILKISYLRNRLRFKTKYKVIEIIETYERVPSTYLKLILGTKGLYETRIKLGSNIWRVFCFFDKGKLVILLNGFTKKSQKTPKKEIDKAIILMNSYYEDKNK